MDTNKKLEELKEQRIILATQIQQATAKLNQILGQIVLLLELENDNANDKKQK